MLEQKKSEKEEEADRNCYILTTAPVFLVAVMKGLCETHGKKKAGGDVSGVKE